MEGNVSCANCAETERLKQQLDQSIQAFLVLKQKLISTDQLITKCESKCGEVEAQQKRIDDLIATCEKQKLELKRVNNELSVKTKQVQPLLQAEKERSATIYRLQNELDELKVSADASCSLNMQYNAKVSQMEEEKKAWLDERRLLKWEITKMKKQKMTEAKKSKRNEEEAAKIEKMMDDSEEERKLTESVETQTDVIVEKVQLRSSTITYKVARNVSSVDVQPIDDVISSDIDLIISSMKRLSKSPLTPIKDDYLFVKPLPPGPAKRSSRGEDVSVGEGSVVEKDVHTNKSQPSLEPGLLSPVAQLDTVGSPKPTSKRLMTLKVPFLYRTATPIRKKKVRFMRLGTLSGFLRKSLYKPKFELLHSGEITRKVKLEVLEDVDSEVDSGADLMETEHIEGGKDHPDEKWNPVVLDHKDGSVDSTKVIGDLQTPESPFTPVPDERADGMCIAHELLSEAIDPVTTTPVSVPASVVPAVTPWYEDASYQQKISSNAGGKSFKDSDSVICDGEDLVTEVGGMGKFSDLLVEKVQAQQKQTIEPVLSIVEKSVPTQLMLEHGEEMAVPLADALEVFDAQEAETQHGALSQIEVTSELRKHVKSSTPNEARILPTANGIGIASPKLMSKKIKSLSSMSTRTSEVVTADNQMIVDTSPTSDSTSVVARVTMSHAALKHVSEASADTRRQQSLSEASDTVSSVSSSLFKSSEEAEEEHSERSELEESFEERMAVSGKASTSGKDATDPGGVRNINETEANPSSPASCSDFLPEVSSTESEAEEKREGHRSPLPPLARQSVSPKNPWSTDLLESPPLLSPASSVRETSEDRSERKFSDSPKVQRSTRSSSRLSLNLESEVKTDLRRSRRTSARLAQDDSVASESMTKSPVSPRKSRRQKTPSIADSDANHRLSVMVVDEDSQDMIVRRTRNKSYTTTDSESERVKTPKRFNRLSSSSESDEETTLSKPENLALESEASHENTGKKKRGRPRKGSVKPLTDDSDASERERRVLRTRTVDGGEPGARTKIALPDRPSAPKRRKTEDVSNAKPAGALHVPSSAISFGVLKDMPPSHFGSVSSDVLGGGEENFTVAPATSPGNRPLRKDTKVFESSFSVVDKKTPDREVEVGGTMIGPLAWSKTVEDTTAKKHGEHSRVVSEQAQSPEIKEASLEPRRSLRKQGALAVSVETAPPVHEQSRTSSEELSGVSKNVILPSVQSDQTSINARVDNSGVLPGTEGRRSPTKVPQLSAKSNNQTLPPDSVECFKVPPPFVEGKKTELSRVKEAAKTCKPIRVLPVNPLNVSRPLKTPDILCVPAEKSDVPSVLDSDWFESVPNLSRDSTPVTPCLKYGSSQKHFRRIEDLDKPEIARRRRPGKESKVVDYAAELQTFLQIKSKVEEKKQDVGNDEKRNEEVDEDSSGSSDEGGLMIDSAYESLPEKSKTQPSSSKTNELATKQRMVSEHERPLISSEDKKANKAEDRRESSIPLEGNEETGTTSTAVRFYGEVGAEAEKRGGEPTPIEWAPLQAQVPTSGKIASLLDLNIPAPIKNSSTLQIAPPARLHLGLGEHALVALKSMHLGGQGNMKYYRRARVGVQKALEALKTSGWNPTTGLPAVCNKLLETQVVKHPDVVPRTMISMILLDKDSPVVENTQPTPSLTSFQQNCISVLLRLEDIVKRRGLTKEHPYAEVIHSVLIGLQYAIFESPTNPQQSTIANFVRFYCALAKCQGKLEMVRSLMIDVVYHYQAYAADFLFVMCTVWPEILRGTVHPLGPGVFEEVLAYLLTNNTKIAHKGYFGSMVNLLDRQYKLTVTRHSPFTKAEELCDHLVEVLKKSADSNELYIVCTCFSILCRWEGLDFACREILDNRLWPVFLLWRQGELHQKAGAFTILAVGMVTRLAHQQGGDRVDRIRDILVKIVTEDVADVVRDMAVEALMMMDLGQKKSSVYEVLKGWKGYTLDRRVAEGLSHYVIQKEKILAVERQ